MTKYYFTFPKDRTLQYYVIITAESEKIARDVFNFLYHKTPLAVIKDSFTPMSNQHLYESITQRKTE